VQYYRNQVDAEKHVKLMTAREFTLGDSGGITLEGDAPQDTNRRMTRLGAKIYKAVQEVLMRQAKTNPVLGGLGAEITRVRVVWRTGPHHSL
jgi:hypothetical protein